MGGIKGCQSPCFLPSMRTVNIVKSINYKKVTTAESQNKKLTKPVKESEGEIKTPFSFTDLKRRNYYIIKGK